MNNKDGFLVVKNTKKFIFDLKPTLINFPKKDFILKDRIEKDSFELLKLIYRNNYSNSKEYFNDILVTISMLDYYLEESYTNKYISDKVLKKLSKELSVITKLIYGWKRYEECENK